MNTIPCSTYSEDDNKDLGSWRAPNHAELAIMVTYLRWYNTEYVHDPDYDYNGNNITFVEDNNNGLKVVEVVNHPKNNGPWFFNSTSTSPPYSCTSWNFTGSYWGRVLGTSYGTEGWGIRTSNANSSESDGSSTPNFTNKINGQYVLFNDSPKESMSVRCVKDIK